MTYYNHNNKVFYSRSGENLPNKLSPIHQDIANYSYPNDLIYGIDSNRIDAVKSSNQQPKITYTINKNIIVNNTKNIFSKPVTSPTDYDTLNDLLNYPEKFINDILTKNGLDPIFTVLPGTQTFNFDNDNVSVFMPLSLSSGSIAYFKPAKTVLNNLQTEYIECLSETSGNNIVSFTVDRRLNFDIVRLFKFEDDGSIVDITMDDDKYKADPITRTIYGSTSSFGSFIIGPSAFYNRTHTPATTGIYDDIVSAQSLPSNNTSINTVSDTNHVSYFYDGKGSIQVCTSDRYGTSCQPVDPPPHPPKPPVIKPGPTIRVVTTIGDTTIITQEPIGYNDPPITPYADPPIPRSWLNPADFPILIGEDGTVIPTDPTIGLDDLGPVCDLTISGGNGATTVLNPDGSIQSIVWNPAQPCPPCPEGQSNSESLANILTAGTNFVRGDCDCGCWETALSVGAVLTALEYALIAYSAWKAAATVASQISRNLIRQAINFRDSKALRDGFERSLEAIQNSVLARKLRERGLVLDAKTAMDIANRKIKLKLTPDERQLFDEIRAAFNRYNAGATEAAQNVVNVIRSPQWIAADRAVTNAAVQLAAAVAALEAAKRATYNYPVINKTKTCPEGQKLNKKCECVADDYSDYSYF